MEIRLIKFLGIFSIVLCILTFVKEDAAALESGDHATPLFVQSFDVSDEEIRPKALPLIMMDQKCILLEQLAMM